MKTSVRYQIEKALAEIEFHPDWGLNIKRAWLKATPNFLKARKIVLGLKGVGVQTWREWIALYGLGESYAPHSL
jgi:hypothetical protein